MTNRRREDERLLELVMQMPGGLAVFLSSGEISYCNYTARNVLEVQPGDNHGLTLTGIYRQVIDTFGYVLQTDQDPVAVTASTGTRVANRMVGIRDRTGEVTWISVSTIPHFDDAGSLVEILASFAVISMPEINEHSASYDNEFAKQLHEHAKIGLWTWNFRTGEFKHDRSFSHVTKIGRLSSVDDWSISVVEQDRLKFLLQFDLLEAGIPEVEFAYKALRTNGSQQLYFVRATTTKSTWEKDGVIEGSVVDITALLPGTLEVGELVESMTDGYLVVDRNWCISTMNKRAENMLNISMTDVVGTGIWDQFPRAFETDIDSQLQLAMSGKHVSFDFASQENGMWLEMRAHPLPNGIAIYFRDITDSRFKVEEHEKRLSISEQARERLLYEASHDSLTNLPNRTALLSWIHDSLTNLPDLRKLAVLFIDLDRFKRVNDTHGHAEGDRVLVQISRILRAMTGNNSTVARLGGDEFIVALHINSMAEAQHFANKIQAEFSKPINVSQRLLVVTASIGIAISDSTSTADTLLRDADVALYVAKEQGRNRVRLFDTAIRQKVVTRLDTEADLRDALRLDQISVHFQPIFGAASKSLMGFETLTRWFHRDKGSILPEIFIPVAEESGLIVPLGEYLVETALRLVPHLSKCAPERERFTVWINVSAKQLEDFSFVNHLISSYQNHCRPGELGIELTESVLSRDSNEIHSILLSLANKGIRVAIDDFGKGYTPLSRLMDYPVDLIILNRSMVEEILSTSGTVLAQALINLAHATNAKVCANGIESELQLSRFIDLGVDYLSGYYLGHPRPIDQIPESIQIGTERLEKLQRYPS